jgi:hypothetical protein
MLPWMMRPERVEATITSIALRRDQPLRPDGQGTLGHYHLANHDLIGRKMTKIIACIALAATSALPVAGAKAMPFAPIDAGQAALTIPVADGCGFNRYRDARGICRKKYVITRHRGRQPLYTGCGGLNSHRVCNLYGQCWMVCD